MVLLPLPMEQALAVDALVAARPIARRAMTAAESLERAQTHTACKDRGLVHRRADVPQPAERAGDQQQ